MPRWKISRGRRRELFRIQEGRCAYCRQVMVLGGADDTAATIDHVVAVARGGRNALHNLVLSCKACNEKKGKNRLVPHRDVAPHVWLDAVPSNNPGAGA